MEIKQKKLDNIHLFDAIFKVVKVIPTQRIEPILNKSKCSSSPISSKNTIDVSLHCQWQYVVKLSLVSATHIVLIRIGKKIRRYWTSSQIMLIWDYKPKFLLNNT